MANYNLIVHVNLYVQYRRENSTKVKHVIISHKYVSKFDEPLPRGNHVIVSHSYVSILDK